MAEKITIEDTGKGFTFAGDHGKYRAWKATSPDGQVFLLFSRSAVHGAPLPAVAPIAEYVEATDELLERALADAIDSTS